MPLYPNPNGGSMTAANDAQAASMGWSPSMGTFGVNTYPDSSGGGSSGGGGGGSSSASSASGAGLQQLLNALASGNQAAAQEAIREFNQTFGLDQQKFQEAVSEYNKNFGLAQAGITGQYNGQPTLAAQNQAEQNAIAQANITGVFQAPSVAGSGQQIAPGWISGSNTAPNGGDWGDVNSTYHVGSDGYIYNDQGANTTVLAASGLPPGTTAKGIGALANATQAQQSAAGPGVPTLAAQKQAADIAAQAAGLSGMFNGNPTEAAREFNATNALNAQTAQNKTATDLLTLAAGLHSDPFRQLQVMYGANGIDGVNRAVQGLIGQYDLSSGGFTAPAGSNTANLGGLAAAYNNAAGTNPQQAAQNTGLLNTNQIIARNYNAAPQNVKDFTTSALSMNNGLSQQDEDKAIQNNLPRFTSPDFGLATV